MKRYFDRLAHYNRWANARLYETAALVSDTDYRRNLGAFFGSLEGTLNHLLVADRVWLWRMTGTGETPQRLDAILFDSFAALRAAREAEDQRIIEVIGGFRESDLERNLDYRNMAGEPKSAPLPVVLGHFFNHQTHHRGQAHSLLTRLGQTPPPLDLIYFSWDPRERPATGAPSSPR